VRPVGLRSAIEGRASLGPGGEDLNGYFAITIIASQRFEDAIRLSRSVPGQTTFAAPACGAGRPSVFDLEVRDCERTVANGHFKPAHGRIRTIVDTLAVQNTLPVLSPLNAEFHCEGLG